MIRTKDLMSFFDNIIYYPEQTDYTPDEIGEYKEEIIKRLRAYDRITTCPEPSNTVDTDKFIEYLAEALDCWKREAISTNEKIQGHEMHTQIVASLKRYDRICHDLKQLIATMSNGLDADK